MPKDLSDPGFKRFEFRNGVGGFKWQGMHTEGDPASAPAGTLGMLINGRVKSGSIQARPGLADFGALNNVLGLHDLQIPPKKIWIGASGCGGFDSGATILTFDQDQDPPKQIFSFSRASADYDLVLGGFDGHVWVGDSVRLRRVEIPPHPYGAIVGDRGGYQDIVYKNFPNAICALQEFDSALYIALFAGGASKIVRFDGQQFTDDLTGLAEPVRTFGIWRDRLVACFDGTINQIKLRAPGVSPSWANIAPAAGTVRCNNDRNATVSYRGDLYIASGTVDLWKYDGTTLAVTHSLAAGSAIKAVAVMLDQLWFGYNTATAARIGSWDGAVAFIDVYKDFTAQQATFTVFNTMVVYRNLLVVGLAGQMSVAYAGVLGDVIWVSPGQDLAGTWLGPPPPYVGGGSGHVENMMVF